MGTMTAAASKKSRSAASAEQLRDEFAYLRRPLLLFLVSLAAAALIVGVSDWVRRDRVQVLTETRARHDAALARLQSAELEMEEIRLYQPRFLQLQGAGMVGAENRLAWVETIRQSQQVRKLLSVTYEIEPQQLVNLSAPIALGDYQLRASRMILHAALLHEMDLFNLLDDLTNAGLYTVQDCRIRRNEVPAEVALSPRMSADCTLVWISLGSAPAVPAVPLPAAAAMGTP
ncbi:MAG TPA: hypothetical protein VFT37_15885 [Telluria sp.]|nr:hypothetical protein [Telluria sp.]